MPNLDLGRFRIYPRGFVGSPIGVRVQKNPSTVESRFKQLSHNLNLFKPSVNSIDPNPAVKELYKQYTTGRKATSAFEYKKRLYMVALYAFGTQNFLEWFKQQMTSPVVGVTHREFLDDTLKFIQTGKPRRMRLETWDSLLQMQDRGVGNEPLSEEAQTFFNYNGKQMWTKELTNTDLIDVLCLWLSQPNGLYDLIGTLHLLFGDTP